MRTTCVTVPRYLAAGSLVLAAACGDGTGSPGAGGGTEQLAETLARTWVSTTGLGGNCTNVGVWHTFGADGSVAERDIDVNACYGTRLLHKFTGVYTLRDRVLEITLNGIGVGQPHLATQTPGDTVAKFVERFPILTGKIAPPWIGNGYLAIDDGAHTSTDGAHFESEHFARLESAAGTKLFEQDLTSVITVDPPLPLEVGQTCTVQVDFTLALFDAAADITEESGSFRLSYDAVARATEPGWMRLVPRVLDTLPDDQRSVAWSTVLETEGVWSNRSVAVANTLGRHFIYYLGYPADDPHVLTKSLPQIARWLEATTPPPIQ